MRCAWAVALLFCGCSSGSGGASVGDEVPVDTGSDAVMAAEGGPDAEPEASPSDSGPDVSEASTSDAGDESIVDSGPDISQIPDAQCSGNPPAGDGGTWCTLYVMGDKDGDPHGESVQMACGPKGSACTACLGGVIFPGVCE